MKNPFFIISIITLISLASCRKSDEASAFPSQIMTDLSVTSSEDIITWFAKSDLSEKLENIISYDHGLAEESRTEIQQIFNDDMTQVSISIDFKQLFQNSYEDPNLVNNSVTIKLERIEGIALQADGPGDTYALITSVLAPGQNPVEVPDCNHAEFGEHIDELFDTELNKHVFRFHIHTTPDDDRCIIFDRQRNEIKSYAPSPDNLLGIENEKVNYSWKFKLNAGFQSSAKFTHLHQLKSVGGEFASHPMYTLTTRKGSPDQLELRYAETETSIRLREVDLAPFLDTWLEVSETIKYGMEGTYDIEIKKVNTGEILLSHSIASIINWRPNADFVRPKWGIYRSLEYAEDLRDEEVLFADFIITEIN